MYQGRKWWLFGRCTDNPKHFDMMYIILWSLLLLLLCCYYPSKCFFWIIKTVFKNCLHQWLNTERFCWKSAYIFLYWKKGKHRAFLHVKHTYCYSVEYVVNVVFKIQMRSFSVNLQDYMYHNWSCSINSHSVREQNKHLSKWILSYEILVCKK